MIMGIMKTKMFKIAATAIVLDFTVAVTIETVIAATVGLTMSKSVGLKAATAAVVAVRVFPWFPQS